MTDIEESITELKVQISLALGALGTALAQTLVELDELSPALAVLRQRTEGLQEHLEGHGNTEAAAMLSTFAAALYNPRLFPGQPGNRR